MTSQDKNDKEEKKILVVNRSKTNQNGDNKKESKDEKIVVVDNKPQNLAPLSGPGFGEDDSAKKKSDSQVVVKSDEPKELAPLGNINTIMDAGDGSTKNSGDKKKETNGNKKKDENVSDLHEKSSVSDKGKGTAMAAGAATGAVAAKPHNAASDNKDTDPSNKNGNKKIADEKKASDNKSDEKKSLGDKIKQHGTAVAAGAGAIAGAVASKAHNAISGNKDEKNGDKDKKPSTNDTEKQNHPVAKDSKQQGEKDNHTALKAGSGAAAVGGATYAVSKGGSGKNNHVSIDEKKNESIPISKNENDAPEKLENPDESSVLHNLRKENKILAEGFVYKKRPWLFCFWVKKYFILLRTGELSFIEVDGTGEPQRNWNIRQASAFNKIDYPEYSYPYRFTFACNSADGYLSFDTMKDRDYWYDSLQDISRSN